MIEKTTRHVIKVGVLIGLIIIFVVINRIVDYCFPTEDASIDYSFVVKEDNGLLRIDGWAVDAKNEDRELDRSVKRIVLRNGNGPFFKNVCITNTERLDIDEVYNGFGKFRYSGFTGCIEKSKIEKNVYKIILELRDGEYIDSGWYLSEGKMQYSDCDVDLFFGKTESQTILDIVDQGLCLYCNQREGICIYQCENMLYWFADNNCKFDDTKNLKMEYRITSNDNETVSLWRKESGLEVQYMTFDFMSFEVFQELDCGLRICCRMIPTEYPVSSIFTAGIINDEIIWSSTIKPVIYCDQKSR